MHNRENRTCQQRSAPSPRHGVAVLILRWTAFALAVAGQMTAARAADLFTVANFPVGAEAANAVAAKQEAIANGQRAALLSLVRRITPVGEYSRLKSLPVERAASMIDGVAVVEERNTRTRYEATLSFTFREDQVRGLLDDARMAYVAEPAPQITVVLAYREPVAESLPAALRGAAGGRQWSDVWRGLDLVNAMAPIRLERQRRELSAGPVDMIVAGRGTAAQELAEIYGTSNVVLAMIEPDLADKKLKLWLSGQDAVGPFRLARELRLDPADFAYVAELAAVISLGILEGRWKAVTPPANPNVTSGWPGTTDGSAKVNAFVQFQTLAEWNRIRTAIEETPDVDAIEINGLSTRDAQVSVSYRRGASELAARLGQRGLQVRETADGLIIGF